MSIWLAIMIIIIICGIAQQSKKNKYEDLELKCKLSKSIEEKQIYSDEIKKYKKEASTLNIMCMLSLLLLGAIIIYFS